MPIETGCLTRQEARQRVFQTEHAFYADVQGIRVHYHDEIIPGAGELQQWLFLHGWVGSSFDYQILIDELRSRFATKARVVIPSLPGSGLSQKNGVDYSVDFFIAFLRAFVDTVGLTTFNLVGHSLGGQMAIWFVSGYPEKVAKLILIAPYGLKDQGGSWFWLARLGPLVNLGMMFNARFFIDIGMRFNSFYDMNKLPSELVDSVAVTLLGPGGRESAAKITKHVLGTKPVDSILRPIDIPVLLVWGDQDRVLDVQWSAKYREHLQSAELVILKNCGHMPMVEAPTDTASAILKFVVE